MAFSPKHSVLLILLGLFLTTGDALGIFNPVMLHVRMFNHLGPEVKLTLHCLSGDDDLGERTIGYKVSWGFRFQLNIWDTTLFHCSFAWKDQFHKFDIFIVERDYDYDDVEEHPWNRWSILPDGPCKFSYNTNQFDICYPWNPTD